jgi:hypothetical protein
VKIEGDPLNTQHAQEEEEEVIVFTLENRGGSAQHATRATPTRSSHGPMRAQPYSIPIQPALWRSSTSPYLRPAEWGELQNEGNSVQIRRDHSLLRLGRSVCLLCDCGSCIKYILRG